MLVIPVSQVNESTWVSLSVFLIVSIKSMYEYCSDLSFASSVTGAVYKARASIAWVSWPCTMRISGVSSRSLHRTNAHLLVHHYTYRQSGS